MNKPRILWCYDHPAARYQETNLFLDAGAEVIVLLGDVATKSFDPEYHNEMSPLYPDWRAHCALPSDVVERLRRMPVHSRGGRLEQNQIALMNATVDVLVTPAEADVVKNILDWFKGVILYRVNGVVNVREYQRKIEALERVAVKKRDQIYLAPGLKVLVPPNTPQLAANTVFLPVWVDIERTPFRWRGVESMPYVATGVSYIDFHFHHRNQYLKFKEGIGPWKYVVVGKNDKRSPHCADPGILGGVSFDELYRTMAQARAFVDAGDMPEHIVFPPIEAMAMGVPTFFTRQSALARILFDEEIPEFDYQGLGCEPDYPAIARRFETEFDDFTALEALVERQNQVFLGRAFSRQRSLENFKEFLGTVRARSRRDERYTTRAFDAFRTQLVPSRFGTASGLSATTIGRTPRRLLASEMRGDVGHIDRDERGNPIRQVDRRRDKPGFLIIDYLPRFEPGRYELSVVLAATERRAPQIAVGYVEWTPDGAIETPFEHSEGAAGEMHHRLEIEITDSSAGWTRELRASWLGGGACALRWAEVRAI